MPAKIITVKSKSKEGLKRQVNKKLKELSSQGLVYVTRGYDSKKVKRSSGFYQIEISAHS